MGIRHAGFTLLEILVALVVFGLLMAGLSQGTSFGLQAWGRQARTIDARSQMDAVDRALRQLIARMDPDSDIVGEAHALAFTSVLPANAIAADPESDVLLRVDGDRLMLHWGTHLHAERFRPPPAPVLTDLLGGVAGVDFAYWPRTGAGGWQDSWHAGGPPGLVRIRLLFPAGDGRRWPDIVVAPVRDRSDG